MKQTCNLQLACVFVALMGLLQSQCADQMNAGVEAVSESENVIVKIVSPDLLKQGLDCDVSIDGDCDGVWTDCDADDTDSGILMSKICDQDRDGYADDLCADVADANDDGLIDDDERLFYGVNCDVCPLVVNEDQADENSDGIGDVCSPSSSTDDEGTEAAEEDVELDISDPQQESENDEVETETLNFGSDRDSIFIFPKLFELPSPKLSAQNLKPMTK